MLYAVNGKESRSTHGTGILVKTSLMPKLQRINERICMAQIQLEHCELHFIAAYAHTLEKAEKCPEDREEFYEILETLVESIPKRDAVIIAGNFNAKTGSGYNDFKENMGRSGKGKMNSSGRRLLEMCQRTDTFLTNTTFQHKLCHRTTWTAPYRNFITWNGETRKNPVRNQIHYIIARNSHEKFVTNSRAYGGTKTDSDHKLVKMDMHFQWTKLPKETKKATKIDTQMHTDKEKQRSFKEKVQQTVTETDLTRDRQDRWSKICNIVKEAGKETLGIKKYSRRLNDQHLQDLTEQHCKLRMDIEEWT